MRRIWVLGAPDPEMEMIERLLRQCGEEVTYATGEDGRRVHPGNAYRCPVPEVPAGSTVYAVECIDELPARWVRIDHHRPGDPGYGRPPIKFFSASSIGQVVAELARNGAVPKSWRRMSAGYAAPLTPQYTEDGTPVDYVGVPWVRPAAGGGYAWDIVIDARTFARAPQEIAYAAAADHCLAAAYRGECPGVDPDDLMRWRVETRAAHQGRSVDDVLADIALARRALQEAPTVDCDFNVEGWCDGCGPNCMFCPRCGTFECGANLECPPDYYMCVGVLDLRDYEVPELPEAAAREGAAYLATVTDRDGREKVVLGGATSPEMVREFMEQWAPAEGLVDIYGDPARGFAGGYLP